MHYLDVMQRVADGRVPIVGHHRQQIELNTYEGEEEEELGDAGRDSDAPGCREEIREHSGGSDRRVEDVQPGQVTQEQVHGSVEAAVTEDQEDNQEVYSQSGQVYAEEQQEQETLDAGPIRQPNKHKFQYFALICRFHLTQVRSEAAGTIIKITLHSNQD